MSIFKLFKKPKDVQPLPDYPPIALEHIPPASTLLFYGGMKLTEMAGNRLYGHKYRPPAFHAAFYIEGGLFLNVGGFKVVQELGKELRSTRRIDVVIYKNIRPEYRKSMLRLAYLDASKPKIGISLPDYSWTDYLRFGLKFLKPSKKDFCSENVVEMFANGQVTVSDKKPVDTAPWDLFEYALDHPDQCEIRTLHIGPEFKV
jgi:hypothetical protein